ncbi:MAG: UvrD-helicase domain-containing protein, partial [Treponema sp.]|nr:UvrD-helicase domain-containing protein [Treponema sp.]
NRFAWLLTEKGYNVNEILTLTFTKKAAVEMNKRIYSLLSEIAETETGIKADRAKIALNDFIHARIQTLDSYSASIVKQCAPRYGISPDFSIDEERCKSLALEISYPFFIARRRHPAIEKLYSDNYPNSIVGEIFAYFLFHYGQIDKPRDLISDVKKQFDIICAEWKNIHEELLSVLRETEELINEDNHLLPELVPIFEYYNREKITIPGADEIRDYLNYLLNLPKDCIKNAESHKLQKVLVTFIYFLDKFNSHSLSLQRGKKSPNPVKDNVKLIRNIFEKLFSMSISCMQAGFTISIMNLLTELQNIYLVKKRAEGVLTFRDVASLSRTILIEQKDIRQSEKETFKTIMIDEFQDNNELQKDILFLLAENLNKSSGAVPEAKDLSPDKLFFVGDEKQSIYLFRGADVSVFRKLKNEIKSSDLPLKINYRSSPHLIGAYNAIFGGCDFDPTGNSELHYNPSVFAPPQSLPVYEAEYTTLEAGCKNEGSLSICLLNKKEEVADVLTRLSSYENEARFVSEKIYELLNITKEQKYQPKDIAILLRDSTHQYLYEKHLRALGIPYICEKVNNLFYGGPVNDIMAVLRLAAHPMDRAAYAEMLRSPFAGLSLPGTAMCMSFLCSNENETEPFNDIPLDFLDTADKEKYINGKKVFLSINESSKSKSVSELVSELWYEAGYRYETEWNPQTAAYKEMYDYLFHLAAKADMENQGLASFTDIMIALRDSGGQLSSDTAIPLERPSAVHLMTIHKSKGLEFPVIFLCCCGKKSQPDKCDVVYFSETTGIAFSPPAPPECRLISSKRSNYFWERVNEEIKRKRTAELRRLLYVAMTRARNELYITGSIDIKDTNETDDFSLKLKYDIESKHENKEKYIDGDSILYNDTLFGILLPAIVSTIPAEGYNKKTCFFNLEEIPVYTEEYIKKQLLKSGGPVNNKKSLNDFINRNEKFYENAIVTKTPFLRKNHIAPASINSNSAETASSRETRSYKNAVVNKEYSGESSSDIFNKVDSILARFLQNSDETPDKINSGSFGTIAHICVEALLNNQEVIIPSNISGLIAPAELTALLENGNELAHRFLDSPLGKIAVNAAIRENEFSFRSLIKNTEGKEIFINGTVDLLFEDETSIHVVDFKTDSREIPGEHTVQMSCYYHAISTLFAAPVKKDCRVWIYYLRTGHAVEITERAKHFNLINRIFD